MNKIFRTNHSVTQADNDKRPIIIGKNATIPGQTTSITEVVYRFQGGIMPTMRNVQYDPTDMPDEDMDVRRLSGFDITDAYQALQAGREKYQKYIKEKNANARKAIENERAELQRLRELEKTIKEQQKIEE